VSGTALQFPNFRPGANGTARLLFFICPWESQCFGLAREDPDERVRMISLRKHIEASPEDLFDATARSYRSVLVTLGRHLARAVPGVPGDLGKNLRVLSEQFGSDPMPATALAIQHTVDSELRQWSDNVEQHLKTKAAEAREIMLVMAGAAQSLASRDKRYADRFRDITAKLRGIADLDDLSAVRRSLMASALDLNAEIGDMETEGQQTILDLELKLQEYRKQLAEAERRACADTLTGLINRRGIEMEIEKLREERLPFCVVLLDLDLFKPVNDNYGHGAGDDLLRQFAGELRGYFRPGDVIGRWGGDEFRWLPAGMKTVPERPLIGFGSGLLVRTESRRSKGFAQSR
jgi:hypothetical protein